MLIVWLKSYTTFKSNHTVGKNQFLYWKTGQKKNIIKEIKSWNWIHICLSCTIWHTSASRPVVVSLQPEVMLVRTCRFHWVLDKHQAVNKWISNCWSSSRRSTNRTVPDPHESFQTQRFQRLLAVPPPPAVDLFPSWRMNARMMIVLFGLHPARIAHMCLRSYERDGEKE